MNIGWIAYIYIFIFFSAGDDLPIICGFQSLLDPDSPGENCWNSLGVETRRSALQPQQRWDWDLHP
jgi:hypothetical protein